MKNKLDNVKAKESESCGCGCLDAVFLNVLRKRGHLHKYLHHLDSLQVSLCTEWRDRCAKHSLHTSRLAAKRNHRHFSPVFFQDIQANNLGQFGKALQSLVLAGIEGNLALLQSTCVNSYSDRFKLGYRRLNKKNH